MAAIQWVLMVVVMTFVGPSLSLPRENHGSSEVTAQEAKALRSSLISTDVTLGVEDKVAGNEVVNKVNITELENIGEKDEQNVIDPVSSLQKVMESSTIGRILNVVIYAIQSYSSSASLGEWVAGLGEAVKHPESHDGARLNLLEPIKFNPFVNNIIETLRPLGFRPYPDPYVPLDLAKIDILKFSLNWLAFFGLLALFWRAYLPLSDEMYEKFGFLEGLPDYYDYDPYEYDEESYEEEEEEEEEDEDDPYGDEEEEEEEEEEEDKYEEEEVEEDHYYKVGEEEKEEEEREHESFAVFREKETEEEMDTLTQHYPYTKGADQGPNHHLQYPSHYQGYHAPPPHHAPRPHHAPQPHHAPEIYYTFHDRAQRKDSKGQGLSPSSRPSSGNHLTNRPVGGSKKPSGRPGQVSNTNRRKSNPKRPSFRARTPKLGRRLGELKTRRSSTTSSSSSSSSFLSSFPFNLFS